MSPQLKGQAKDEVIQHVGNDGLTESQRSKYLEQFQRGIGAPLTSAQISRAKDRAARRLAESSLGTL